MEEEKELEQTNEEEVADQEFDDTSNESTETIVEQEAEQPKTFTQDDVNNIVEDRIKRERRRMERENRESLSKYQELAYLTQEGLKTNSLDETLDKSREFYGKQGIKYTPNNADDEIVGKYYADEIIEDADSIDDLEKQVKKISSKPNKSTREEVVLKNLNDEISHRRRISELRTIGVTEEEYDSKEFKDFEKKFTNDTPIKDVYELYRLRTTAEKPVDNPGSMKSTPGKEKRNYISPSEYDKMTDKEIEENMDLIRESMYKWKS